VGSAVFDAMFNSTLATQEDEITIPDVEPAAFLALLRFLYRYLKSLWRGEGETLLLVIHLQRGRFGLKNSPLLFKRDIGSSCLYICTENIW
jgi:hypothetical protein